MRLRPLPTTTNEDALKALTTKRTMLKITERDAAQRIRKLERCPVLVEEIDALAALDLAPRTLTRMINDDEIENCVIHDPKNRRLFRRSQLIAMIEAAIEYAE